MKQRNVNLRFKKSTTSDKGMIYLLYLRANYKTGITCKESDFDLKQGVLPSDPNYKMKCARLNLFRNKIVTLIGDNNVTEEEFKMICMQVIDPEKYELIKAEQEAANRMTFLKCYDERMSKVEKPKTALMYAHTMGLVKEF